MSNGPVAKLKVTGVAAARSRPPLSAQRENRAAIIVSYGDHAGVYLFAVAPVIYDENASAVRSVRPAQLRCILRVSMTRRYFIEKSQNVAPASLPLPPPPPSPLTPFALSHKSTAFKSVTGKIRSDVPHLSRRRSILSLLDWGIENFWRPSPCATIYYFR